MTVTARLDATLCFVDDDRITLLDENESEDGEHEQKGKDKEGNKPMESAKKGLCSLSSVLWNTYSPISLIGYERKGLWTDSVALLVITKLEKGKEDKKDKSENEEEEEDEDEDDDDGEGAWDNGDIGK